MEIDIKKHLIVFWRFLFVVLKVMNFPDHWKQLIIDCVTSTSAKILINGEFIEPFQLKAGLRQRDPLSSYLFILYMNILSSQMEKEKREGRIPRIKITRTTPSINHLLYAYDLIIFYRVNSQSIEALKNILYSFGRASGLYKNDQKSEIRFSPSTSRDKGLETERMLGCKPMDIVG